MAGHTKGPWVHYDDSNRAIPRHTVVAAGKTVTTVYCTKGQESEDAANARLIAAAPDLLEALKAVVDQHTKFMARNGNQEDAYNLLATRWDIFDDARASIAKAEQSA